MINYNKPDIVSCFMQNTQIDSSKPNGTAKNTTQNLYAVDKEFFSCVFTDFAGRFLARDLHRHEPHNK
jgi:hypothetical protein